MPPTQAFTTRQNVSAWRKFFWSKLVSVSSSRPEPANRLERSLRGRTTLPRGQALAPKPRSKGTMSRSARIVSWRARRRCHGLRRGCGAFWRECKISALRGDRWQARGSFCHRRPHCAECAAGGGGLARARARSHHGNRRQSSYRRSGRQGGRDRDLVAEVLPEGKINALQELSSAASRRSPSLAMASMMRRR